MAYNKDISNIANLHTTIKDIFEFKKKPIKYSILYTLLKWRSEICWTNITKSISIYALYEHVLDNDHAKDYNNYYILAKESNTNKRLYLKIFFIIQILKAYMIYNLFTYLF